MYIRTQQKEKEERKKKKGGKGRKRKKKNKMMKNSQSHPGPSFCEATVLNHYARQKYNKKEIWFAVT